MVERMEEEAHVGWGSHRKMSSMDSRDPEQGAHVVTAGFPVTTDSPRHGSAAQTRNDDSSS
jgi:hypothetical protein